MATISGWILCRIGILTPRANPHSLSYAMSCCYYYSNMSIRIHIVFVYSINIMTLMFVPIFPRVYLKYP